jgi:hypothetical protein
LAANTLAYTYKRRSGKELDYSRAYFLPPLDPLRAFCVEATQIERLGLNPIVSITDHDTVAGSREMQFFASPHSTPISLEWTAPAENGSFHIGIHNLPADSATEIVNGLSSARCGGCQEAQTSCVGIHDSRCAGIARDWLRVIASIPDVLVVLNHPLWDTKGSGAAEHERRLRAFLAANRDCIHALEVNGFRAWHENVAVMTLARQSHLPLVSGGDRHGCEPSAVLNLTNASNFRNSHRRSAAENPL